MPAFEGAVALGYRYVETDVHACADGTVVAFHDEVLDRVCDRPGRIAELTWDEVSRARVDGREPIPRLEDLLEAFPNVRINIDPKHDGVVGPLCEVIRRFDAVDRVCIGAFDDARIARVRSILGPRLCTALGPRGVMRLMAASRRLAPARFAGTAAQVPTHHGRIPLVTRQFVRGAHRLGIQVHVWTIDDPVEMHRLLDLGVDGIMTDRCEVLKDVLVERGRWVDA
jgi:glycerophosphoryl diester phosphodiesterase